jgi:hypothetical protein
MKPAALLLMTSALLCGCAFYDSKTGFVPTRLEEGYQYFRYRSFADAAYPLDDAAAEKARTGWLETWLADSGYAGTPYEVTKRDVLFRNTNARGDVYDLHYDVRVIAH